MFFPPHPNYHAFRVKSIILHLSRTPWYVSILTLVLHRSSKDINIITTSLYLQKNLCYLTNLRKIIGAVTNLCSTHCDFISGCFNKIISTVRKRITVKYCKNLDFRSTLKLKRCVHCIAKVLWLFYINEVL